MRRQVEEEQRKIEAAQAAIEVEKGQRAELAAAAEDEVRKANAEIAQLEADAAYLTARIEAVTSSGGGYTGEWSGPWARPVNGRLTSPFGYRIHPILRVRKMHTGVDLSAPSGTPIMAAGDGRSSTEVGAVATATPLSSTTAVEEPHSTPTCRDSRARWGRWSRAANRSGRWVVPA